MSRKRIWVGLALLALGQLALLPGCASRPAAAGETTPTVARVIQNLSLIHI